MFGLRVGEVVVINCMFQLYRLFVKGFEKLIFFLCMLEFLIFKVVIFVEFEVSYN